MHAGHELPMATTAGQSEANMRWASWASFVFGLWLIVSPFALRYSSVGAAMPNDVVFGILIAAFSLWTAATFEAPPIPSWLVVVFGAWVFIAGLVLHNSGQATLAIANQLITGAIVFVLGLVRALGVGRRLTTR
jgi:hypothetical protein